MHPELESFFENALHSVRQTSPEIGRVVIEPDYDVEPDPKTADLLGIELVKCLREVKVNNDALATQNGQEITIPEQYPLLRKYMRRITLHVDRIEGDWIEIAPPGNWI